MPSKIEWTEETWNPITGCSPISDGCRNCYAARLAATRLKNHEKYSGLTKPGKMAFNGEIRFHLGEIMKPLHWRKPRRIFPCSMGDLFHSKVKISELNMIFNIITSCWEKNLGHKFLILTKRPGRMRKYIKEHINYETAVCAQETSNVWLGVTVESDKYLWRIKDLLQTPAAVHFVSIEPMLGPVDLAGDDDGHHFFSFENEEGTITKGLDWVIAGCESGPGRRYAQYEWFKYLKDQCIDAGVPFFLKQMDEEIWGEAPKLIKMPQIDGRVWDQYPQPTASTDTPNGGG